MEASTTFVARIVEVCKKIMSETKALRELGDQRNEDMLLEPAKRTAVVTFELVDLVREQIVQNCLAAGLPEDDFSVTEYLFLENTDAVRSSVLSLIDAIKSGVANPFDFMSQQNVENATKQVVSSITQIIGSVKDFSTIDNSQSSWAKQELLVRNIKAANMALTSMSEAFSTNHQVLFTTASKALVETFKTLMKFSQDEDLNMEDELKTCTIELIKAAKLAISQSEEQAEADHLLAQEAWARAKSAACDILERFIAKIMNTWKSSNGPLGRSRWNLLMKPPSTTSQPTPEPSVTSPVVTAASPRFSVPIKKVPPPLPTSPPPSSRSTGRWEAVNTKKPVEKNANFLAARGTVASALSDSAPHGPVNGLSQSMNNVPIRKVSISGPDTSSAVTNPPRTVETKEVADRIINSLTRHFPLFRSEWGKLDKDTMDKLTKTLVVEHLLLPRKRNTNSHVEEDEEIADLRKLLDTNDIQKMSYELKCLTRRLEKKSRQQQTLGRAFTSKNSLEALASAEYQPDITDLEGTLKDCMRDYREAVFQFTTTLGNCVITAFTENSPTEGPAKQHSAVVKTYRDLLLLMQEGAKIAQYWMQQHKDTTTNKDSKTLSEKKREALKQKEAFQNSVKSYALNYISVTQAQLEKAQTKGKANQYIINLITESEGESEEYISSLKTRLEELVHNQLLDDIATLRSLTTQVVLTLKHMTSKRSNESAALQMCAFLRNTLEAGTSILNNFETFMYITKPDFQNASSGKMKSPLDVPSGKRTRNLWLEQSQLLRNTDEILGGTLNQIILYLTGESADQLFIKTFLLTYQSFTDPYNLLEKLEQCYAGPPTGPPPPNFIKIKMRVGVVLKCWIEMQFDDFDPALSRKLQMFITDVIAKEEAMRVMAERLMAEVNRRSVDQASRIEAKKNHTQYAVDAKPAEHDLSAFEYFLRTKEEDIARQLTFLEFGIFKQIKATEFLNQAWNSAKLKHKSPHVLHLIAKANKISFWVASIILCQNKTTDRARIIEKFIRIGECLLKLNNFNSLIAIIAGLNVSAVSRLKITWDAVEKPSLDMLKKLQSIFDPGNSNKTYRKERNEATSKGIVMPYIGVTLSDLTFAEDGNPDFLQDNPSLINFAKRVLVSRLITDIQLNQQMSYTLTSIEDGFFLQEFPHINEKDLYELSLVKEPRGVSAQAMAKLEAD